MAVIRVLSFMIWYHLAYVVISTALLGFGASGTFLAIRSSFGAADLPGTLRRVCIGAGISGALFVLFMSAFPFDPMFLLKSPRDFALMLCYQLGASVPFLFPGSPSAWRSVTVPIGSNGFTFGISSAPGSAAPCPCG